MSENDINTGGGTVVEGSVDTGKDFIGRDLNTTTTHTANTTITNKVSGNTMVALVAVSIVGIIAALVIFLPYISTSPTVKSSPTSNAPSSGGSEGTVTPPVEISIPSHLSSTIQNPTPTTKLVVKKLPVVMLLDSADPDLVYVESTRNNGGHNTDDISEILDDILPIANIKSELVHTGWRRQDFVIGEQPDLIIIHASAFLTITNNYDSATEREADTRLLSFLKYASEETKSQFMIYSRGFCGEPNAYWEHQYEKYVPTLNGRFHVFRLCPPDPSWENPSIELDLKRQVKTILQLRN